MHHIIIDELAADYARRKEIAILARQKQMYPDCDGYIIYTRCTKELKLKGR